MTNEVNFRFDDSGLQRLLKAMSGDHSVRIGIFGSMHTPKRKEAGEKKKGFSDQGRLGSRRLAQALSSTTNAEVGFQMEYGVPRMGRKPPIPARSWLRMPLTLKINDIVKDSARGFEAAVKSGDPLRFLTILGINAEKWIQLAFDTRGFGSWAANAASTAARKGSDTPLIDTGQLRRSVASVVI